MMKKYFLFYGLIFSMMSCSEDDMTSLEPKSTFKPELVDFDGVKAIKIDESTYSFPLIDDLGLSNPELKNARRARKVENLSPIHLDALGWNWNRIRNHYQDWAACVCSNDWNMNDTRQIPDGIWFNGYTMGGGKAPDASLGVGSAFLIADSPTMGNRSTQESGYKTIGSAEIHVNTGTTFDPNRRRHFPVNRSPMAEVDENVKSSVWHTITQSISVKSMMQLGVFPLLSNGNPIAPSNTAGLLGIDIGGTREKRNIEEKSTTIKFRFPINTRLGITKVLWQVQRKNIKSTQHYEANVFLNGKAHLNYPKRFPETRTKSKVIWVAELNPPNKVQKGIIEEDYFHYRLLITETACRGCKQSDLISY